MRRSWVALFALLLLAARGTLPPLTPTITEPVVDGLVLAPSDVHMEAWSYSDPENNPHASSDVELWKIATNEKIWESPAISGIEKNHLHLGDGVFVGAYLNRHELEYDTNYRLQFRFRDSTGEVSPWALRLFRTSLSGPPGLPGQVPWVAAAGVVVEEVAGGFEMPVNIAFVPNPGLNPTDPLFYVTELYGTIKMVQRNGVVGVYAGGSALGGSNPASLINFNPTGFFPGSGEQGLAGICVDPLTGDVFASLLYASPAPNGPHYAKVIRLASTDGGRTASSITTILQMPGEDQGQSHFVSNLSIGPDGKLYVHNGDGFDYTTAPNLDLYRGKILRMNLNGTPATDNPFYDAANGINARDYVWAYGLRNPFGGGWRASDGSHYEVENGPSVDRFAKVVAGRNFGWNNTDASMATFAIHNWSPAHGPVNVTFLQPSTFGGSGFPAGRMDHAFVTESGPTYAQGPQPLGKRIVEFVLDAQGNKISGPTTFIEYVGNGRGSAVGLAPGPDGLYFTELYKDQNATSPVQAGARVFRARWVGLVSGIGTGLVADYYTGTNFGTLVLSRTDADINLPLSWDPPAPGVPADNFSVRWTGFVTPTTSEVYTFTTNTDDGSRLWVNDQLLVDDWTNHGPKETSGQIVLQAGQTYPLKMEYFEAGGGSVAQLLWSTATIAKQIVPQQQLSLTSSSPTAVVTPTFSPTPGNFSSPLSVVISTTTAGASIRYTTNGSAPTSTTGTLYSAPVPISATTNFRAIAYKAGVSDSGIANGTYTFVVPTVADPTFTPAPGTFSSPLSVTLACATAGASIRYTTDGSTPTATTGIPYSTPVPISATTNFRAIATKAGMVDSAVVNATYTYAPSGTGSGLTGDYYSGIAFNTFVLSRVDPFIDFLEWGAVAPGVPADNFSIRWTGKVLPQYTETYTFFLTLDDGGRLWINNQLIVDKWVDQSFVEWSGTIALVAGQQADIKIEYYEKGAGAGCRLAWSSPSRPKQVIPTTALYPANALPPAVAAPAFSPTPGAFSGPMSVTISSATVGASLRYTTDGSTPSSTTGTLYTAPVPISATTSFRAVAFLAGMTDSAVVNATYTFVPGVVTSPLFSPAPGNFSSPMSVTISSATAGASIRYTTDGSAPTSTIGTLYSGPVLISATTAFRAIAFLAGMTDSAVVNATYTFVPGLVAAPSFSPVPGNFPSPMSVTISSATAGASIRYATDGSTPTSTTGILYSAAVPISATTTFRAIAYKAGMTDSAVTTATYTFAPPVVAAPTYSPAPGTFSSPMAVTISSATTGASIRYTTDGSAPTATTGTPYVSPIAISATTNFRAIATKAGMVDSAVVNATYTYAPSGTGTGLTGDYYSGIAFNTFVLSRIDPFIDFLEWGSVAPGVPADNFSIRWTGKVLPQYTETYTFFLTLDDGGRLWVNNQLIIDKWVDQSFVEWSGTIALVAGQQADIKIEYYEKGAGAGCRFAWSSPSRPKQVIPTTALYPANALPPAVAAPAYSPTPGTFSGPMSVTISSATVGASIRYTTDGTAPTPTTGTLYAAAVPISATTTFRAIAYKTGMTDSPVVNGAYTFVAPVAANPTYSPAPGNFPSPMSVTISSATAGASIRYTTDGSTPTSSAGILYSTPVPISATTTFRAIAYAAGMTDSAVTTATYTYAPGTVANPAYSPAPGTFPSPMSVTISSTTAGASIRYTIDGTAPTSTTGILYSAPVPISTSTNFRAIAVKSGMVDSAVVNATYTYSPSGLGTGLTGDYYSGIAFNTFVLTRVDPFIDFLEWGSLAPGVPADNFSIRWTGKVLPQYTETYTFFLTLDDGGRLWVNNQLIIDKWIDQSFVEWSGTIALVAGQQADIKIEFYEKGAGAGCRFAWSSPSQPKQVIPQTRLFPSGGALPKSSVVDGDTLQSLLDGAQAGETVSLGIGSFTVPSAGLFVPVGVSLKGAGPGETFLDGAGAPAVVRLLGGPVTIEGMTLTGGADGVNTGTADAVLAHLVIARNSGDGVVVEAGGTVDARYLTVADNGGNGFSSTGTALLGQSIVAGNVGTGVVGATVTSSSVDLPVAFVDPAALDYRVVGGSTQGAYAEDPRKAATPAMPGGTGGGGCGAIGLEGFLLMGLLMSLRRRR